MELVAGYPYWLIKSGLPYQYPKLTENKRCSVAIVGGGISGALAAYCCTRAGMECILVDGRTIGLGSTCASTSLLQYELDVPLHKLKKTVGSRHAIRAYQVCAEAIDKLLALMKELDFKEYSKKQSLFFSRHKAEMESMQEEYLARKEAGFDVQLLSSTEIKKEYGLNATCGILSNKAASNNAYLFTHTLLQHCLTKGFQVFDRTKVRIVKGKNNDQILQTDEGFLIQCKHVINASGYEVINFIGNKIVNLDCTYAVISESMTTGSMWKDDIIMWNTDDPYLYLCTTPDHRIMMGGRDEPFVNMKTMHRYVDKKTHLLEKDFRKCFPSLSFKKEFAWSGVFGKTKDALPYIGSHPDTPGISYALGFGGNGITFSMVAAEIIADLLGGKKNGDAEIFSFAR